MTIIKTSLLAATIACFVACGANREEKVTSNQNEFYGNAVAQNKNADATSVISEENKKTGEPIAERKLIKNGEIAFETKSIIATKAFLQKITANNKGYISNERIEDYKTNPTEILTIRVPNYNFDHLINDIGQNVGEFDTKKIDIDDVTAEFVDIEARLKNKKQLEGKYQELLAKATKMEDILKIEAEISGIREDIESTEGRLRYLNNQVGYSTLLITYYEHKPSSGFKFGNKVSEAFLNGGTSFLWVVIGLIHLWPLWLIGGIIWYGIYKLVTRKKKKVIGI